MDGTEYEAGMYYTVWAQCHTEGCVQNLEEPTEYQEVHSNAGELRVLCGSCRVDKEIVSATLMDPQPEVS